MFNISNKSDHTASNESMTSKQWNTKTPMDTDVTYNEGFARQLHGGMEEIAKVLRKDRKSPGQNSDLASPANINSFTAGASLLCAVVMNTRSYTSSPAYVFILSGWRKHEDRFITAAGVLSCTSASEGCISKNAVVEITGLLTKDPYFLSRKLRIPALPQRHFGKHLLVCNVLSPVFSDVH